MAGANISAALRHNNLLFALNSKRSTSLFLFRNSISLNSPSSSVLSSPSQLHLPSKSPNSRTAITRVSTAPVEYASSAEFGFFQEEIARLRALLQSLSRCRDSWEKRRLIDSDSRVRSFFKAMSDFAGEGLSEYEMYLL